MTVNATLRKICKHATLFYFRNYSELLPRETRQKMAECRALDQELKPGSSEYKAAVPNTTAKLGQ